jgi:hypothetical protein
MIKRLIYLTILCASSLFAQIPSEPVNVFRNPSQSISALNPFVMTINAASVTMSFKGTGLIKVNWGDGLYTVYDLKYVAQNVSHTYASSALRTVTIYNPSKITSWISTDAATYTFDWAQIAKTNITFYQNTSTTCVHTGVLFFNPNMTYCFAGGTSNAFTAGAFPVFPAGMTYCYIGGNSNAFTGSLPAIPSVMDHCYIYGNSNAFTGSFPAIPSGLQTISISGNSNAFVGTFSLSSTVGYCFISGNANTFTGSVSVPTSLTYLYLSSASLSGYTTQSFSQTINRFYLVMSTGSGMTQAEVDQLCIDLDGSAWAGTSKTLRLTGSKIAAPSAASAVARTSLAAKGVAITTN